MQNDSCDKYWENAVYMPLDKAVDYWCDINDPECREAKEHAILGGCEKKEIKYRRNDGKTWDDPVYDLAGRGVLLIDRESFRSWAEKLDQEEYILEPDWETYARCPYLNTNECACLIEGVNPELYAIPELNPADEEDYFHSHNLPDKTVKKIERTWMILERCTGVDLPPIIPVPILLEGTRQYNYNTADFIMWARVKKYELNALFLEAFDRLDSRKATLSSANPAVSVPYLDKDHPCYSPKLATAINAWEYAVEQHGLNQITPGKHIGKWLEDNESSLEITISTKLKETISDIANFKTASGPISAIQKEENAREMAIYRSKNDNDYNSLVAKTIRSRKGVQAP